MKPSIIMFFIPISEFIEVIYTILFMLFHMYSIRLRFSEYCRRNM